METICKEIESIGYNSKPYEQEFMGALILVAGKQDL